MEVINIKAQISGKIMDAIVRNLEKDVPDSVRQNIHEMAVRRQAIHNRMSEAKAIDMEDVKVFNRLCYEVFPMEQDGAEMHKEEAAKPEPEKKTEATLYRSMTPNDENAIFIVHDFIMERMDKSMPIPDFEVYIVWKCKTLQNWKWMLASTLLDSQYYELTFNGDKKEYYLDAYAKFENRVVKGDE